MGIVRIGLDLANVLSVCGVDEYGKAAVRKTFRPDQVLAWFAQVPVAVVGMEACSGAHDRIMDSRFVAPRARFLARPSGAPCSPLLGRRTSECACDT